MGAQAGQAAASGTPPHITQFISDTCAAQIPGAQSTPAAFRILLSAVDAQIAMLCASGAADTADYGYSNLYLQDGSLMAKTVSTKSRLHLYGRSSLTPTDGSIQVATHWKTPEYISSKGQATSVWFVPAWSVKT